MVPCRFSGRGHSQEMGMLVFRRISAALAAFALVFMLSACAGGPAVVHSDEGADDIGAVVEVANMQYSPATVTITVGQAVTWNFNDGVVKHDVLSDDESFVSELMNQGSYTHVFDKPGTYNYSCSVHPIMVETVIVK